MDRDDQGLRAVCFVMSATTRRRAGREAVWYPGPWPGRLAWLPTPTSIAPHAVLQPAFEAALGLFPNQSQRRRLALPPRSAAESLFTGAGDASPGPLTLASALFPSSDSDGGGGGDANSSSGATTTFMQLLISSLAPPPQQQHEAERGRGGSGVARAGPALSVAPPASASAGAPVFTVPPGLGPLVCSTPLGCSSHLLGEGGAQVLHLLPRPPDQPRGVGRRVPVQRHEAPRRPHDGGEDHARQVLDVVAAGAGAGDALVVVSRRAQLLHAADDARAVHLEEQVVRLLRVAEPAEARERLQELGPRRPRVLRQGGQAGGDPRLRGGQRAHARRERDRSVVGGGLLLHRLQRSASQLQELERLVHPVLGQKLVQF
ncbi:hypothetical protein BDA96_10G267700 [Sorghum bicolor]|uniref:Uncharacterized protein n=1 Tax=Sorghum bicolor TaxID=4558 RepID=A0A921Q5E1_SORBI|nr:hypothetical protein BDA96_10G267700 [Sorghum bicolor]